MSTLQMHMRTVPRKYTHKNKFNFNNLQSHNLLQALTEQNTPKFELQSGENCYNFLTNPVERTNIKKKVKKLPISHEFQMKIIQHIPIQQIKTDRKSRETLQPLLKSIQTQRGNFHIRKIAYSAKSSTNQSETKTLSGPQKQDNQDWEAPDASYNSSKVGIENLVRVSRTTIKRKNTQKMLIAASNKLPFSLQKNKNTRQFHKMEQKKRHETLFSQNGLFELDLSQIIQNKQQNDLNEYQSISDLNIIKLL